MCTSFQWRGKSVQERILGWENRACGEGGREKQLRKCLTALLLTYTITIDSELGLLRNPGEDSSVLVFGSPPALHQVRNPVASSKSWGSPRSEDHPGQDRGRCSDMEAGSVKMSTRVAAWICLWIVLTVCPCQADEWQWRPIAWKGVSVNSVVAPRDSADVLYITITSGISEELFGVHKSHDGGMTWRFLPESNHRGAAILTIDPKSQSTVYCGSGGPNFVDPSAYPRRSRDAGAHWEVIEAPVQRIVASPCIDSLLLAVGRPMLYWDLRRSTDDGATWDYLSGVESTYPSDNIIFNVVDSLEVFSWYYYISGLHGLARSRDAGVTWPVVLEGLIGGFDQHPLDSDHWIAMKLDLYTYTSYFCESFDDGDTWDSRLLPDNIEHARGIAFDRNDPRIIYLVAAYANYTHLGMYRSTDGGDTWATMNEGFSRIGLTWEIFQTNGRPGRLLAARGDELWEWTNQQHGEVPGATTSELLHLESVSPCPFRTAVVGRMVIPMSSVVDARVYSVRGTLVRHLFTMPFSRGSHSFIWNGRNGSGRGVAPGAYILRIQAGEAQASLRVVKLE